jgi:ankyrin repeat protein
LFQAIQTEDNTAVKRLLDSGVSANAKDADGTPALMAATLFADAQGVQLLLDRGADPNASNGVGATALMWAVPDLTKTQLLVVRGADVNARSTNLQRTPLLIAASYPRSVAVLKFLLEKGADLHARDSTGIDALGRAAMFADVEAVRFLVENGSDPNQTGLGRAIARAFARHDLPIIQYLMSKGAKPDAELLSVTNWQPPNLVERWIDMGANVNAGVGPYNRTPLMMAVASEQAGVATVKLLLEKGADPNAEDAEGERPLDWAMYRADQSKIEVLRQFGAKPGHGPRQQAYPAPEEGGTPDARTSLTRSIARLLPAAPAIFEKRRCVSCHNQALPAEVAVVARRRGIAIDEEQARKNLDQIVTAYKPLAEAALQGDQPAGNFVTAGYVMSALAAEHHPLDKITGAFTHLVAALQMPDGRWLGSGVSRPPMEDSVVSQTAMAIRVLTLNPIPGRRASLEETLRLAQRWLIGVNPGTTEERNMRLMGLAWTKATRQLLREATRDVIAHQRADGGWSQHTDYPPDAYATGMSLYALHEAGIPVGDEAYRKGVSFLLKTQYQNGAWFVKTRSFPGQPYFESGFPFGHNQWISAAGTGWASLAIAYTLPDVKPAQAAISRPVREGQVSAVFDE